MINDFIKNHKKLAIGVGVYLAIMMVLVIVVLVTNNSNKNSSTTDNQEISNNDTSDNNDSNSNDDNEETVDPNKYTVDIENYNSIVKNMPSDRKDIIDQHLYSLVKKDAKAEIRDNSYNQTYLSNKGIYYTSMIVDIPQLKQSYRITDYWSPIPSNNTSSYATMIYCLPDDQLKYGRFDCKAFSNDQYLRDRETMLK